MTKDEQTARLLKNAEEAIVQLKRDNAACSDYVDELTSRLEREVGEIKRLGGKIDQLEDLLSDVSAERDDVRLLVQSLRADMEKIRDVALDTLKNTKDKSSLVTMAVKFYDVKTLVDERLKLTRTKNK